MGLVWPSPMSQYPADFDLPIVDHVHARHRGLHWPFQNNLRLDQETFYPDVDVRDYDTGYAIDMELPGLEDKRNIKVEWTSKHDIMISGHLARTSLPAAARHQDANGKEDTDRSTKTADKDNKEDGLTPTLLVSERKTGHFRRKFHLPMEVDASNLRAKLENGLLKIRVDRVKMDERTSGQAQIE
ncbi:hypothetical protein D6C78_03729 [Aureobasidium pullulans]|uniref:SHSP domain-containing protein n=1 Tax=Aureobasidium pullulans TaxID=5580 RepID=A0A4S8SL61_AURPU|nr:hypothetical protein D6D29_09605 [Aureobasidium pullulans]TIA38800.1 hypothetical protein D6C78_03729 [Aureobasidium pullulans]